VAELIDRKRKGEKIAPAKSPKLAPVVDLMAALRESVARQRPSQRPSQRRSIATRSSAKKPRAASRRRA
jgi:non-homologous end joining protein Ku